MPYVAIIVAKIKGAESWWLRLEKHVAKGGSLGGDLGRRCLKCWGNTFRAKIAKGDTGAFSASRKGLRV